MTKKPKEVSVIKRKVNKVLAVAQSIEIKNKEDLKSGINLLSKIKKTGKTIKERKDKIIKPIRESIKSARKMFKPIEKDFEEAEKIVKDKILKYKEKVEEKRKKEEKKIEKKINKGDIKIEEAVEEMKELPEDVKEAEEGKVSTRTIKEVVIKDESKLPREYLKPNKSLIRKDALKGVKIAGVEIKEKKILASYTK